MNIKTYIDKSNTIVYNSTINTAQNPVCELCYGDGFTRVLININIDRIRDMINDKTFADTTKLRHVLKMKNCWGFQSLRTNIFLSSSKETPKERTSGFDLYLLRMPEFWDSGVGNSYSVDGFLTKGITVSENGSNWYNSTTEVEWIEGPGAITGITTGNTVFVQHFDIGNEDIEMDITNEVNQIILDNIPNNGFMLCFPKVLEDTNTPIEQYVGFFTNNTTTFFKPYLETTYDENIIDDRNHFYSGKNNKLYFYSLIGGAYQNLDDGLTCTIDGDAYTVKQATKGIYYVELPASITETLTEGEMYYDIWSGISYNGKPLPDVELEFLVKNSSEYFNFSNTPYEPERYVPSVYGIKMGEKLNRGQIKKVYVNPRVEYTTNMVDNITGMEYRVYVKETNKEITVIDYQSINRTFNSNFFMIDTNSLLPNIYYIDIKISINNEELIHKARLMFEIVSELKN